MVVFLVPYVSKCVFPFVLTDFFKCGWPVPRMRSWNMEREKWEMKRIALCSGGGSNVLYLWAWDSSLTGCFNKCLDDCLISSTSRRHGALGVSRCFPSELWHIHSLLSHCLERGTAALYWFLIMSYFLFYFLYWILDDVFGLVTRLCSGLFLAVPTWAYAASYSVSTLGSFLAIKTDGTWSQLTIQASVVVNN